MIEPEVSLILLESVLRSEVLPPPEGPMMERSSPGLASPVTLLFMEKKREEKSIRVGYYDNHFKKQKTKTKNKKKKSLKKQEQNKTKQNKLTVRYPL